MATITIEALKADFEAGIITAVKCGGYTRFTCSISGARWAVVKMENGDYKIAYEVLGGDAWSYADFNASLESLGFTVVSNEKNETLVIPANTLQDYVIQILDKPELIALKKFFHTCRKTKNCDCLGLALRIEHCARHDAIVARNRANPIFKDRYGC